MASTPPPHHPFSMPPPRLPSPSGSQHRSRSSIGSTFSFGPQNLVDSYMDANSSTLSFQMPLSYPHPAPHSHAALDPNRSVLLSSPLRSPRKKHGHDRRGKSSTSRPHPLANDTTDVFTDNQPRGNDISIGDDSQEYQPHDSSDGDADDESEYEDHEWGMVDRMRLWRHDALMQHLYDTACFWGDKVLSFTNDPNDAFWLAQTFFMMNQYSRAERLLTRPFPTTPPPPPEGVIPRSAPVPGSPSPVLLIPIPMPMDMSIPLPPAPTINGNAKGKAKEQPTPAPSSREYDASQLMLSMPRLPAQPNPTSQPPIPTPRIPTHPNDLLSLPEDAQSRVSRLVDMSVACRYLAALCQVRQGKWDEATEMLGESNPFGGKDDDTAPTPNADAGIKVEASMCHLRGILMLKLNRGVQAKQCFMEALALDVKCYESFEQLMSGEMMTPDEEWHFINSLPYSSHLPSSPSHPSPDAHFIQLIYTSRLRKYSHATEHALTRQALVSTYGLGDNPDVLFSFADSLYCGFRWADCWVITSRILSLTQIHNPTLPLHISCMYHLQHLHSHLFMLAHEMVAREPENALSWYAVGVWYLSTSKYSQARQYFSKTSLMDPRFGPAWVAFAHTFALEGEHEHAVTAYSTCARMFTGSHLPLLFVGMEHILLSNYKLADEALDASFSMCDSDPLLINERAVMAFNHGEYDKAAQMFQQAITLAEVAQSSQKAWATTYLNLGTCFRKLRRYEEARQTYLRVLELDPRHATALGFLGIVYHLLGELDRAIVKYHEALSIDPINPHILDLLNIALESGTVTGPGGKVVDAEFKKTIRLLKGKYGRVKEGKGKEKEREGKHADEEKGADEMSIG